MKKYLILLLITTKFIFAQSFTNVTATLTDNTAQVWTGATVTVSLRPAPNNPGVPLNQGHPITDSPQSTITNGSGTFTLTVDDTSKITPSGALWTFTMCPNATVTSCSIINIPVTGVSVDLSAILSNALIPINAFASPFANRAYQDSQVTGGFGGLYWRTSDNVLRGCATTVNNVCTVWTTIGNIGVPGAINQIPFNNGSGSFSASSNLTFNSGTNTLATTNISLTGTLNGGFTLSGNIAGTPTFTGNYISSGNPIFSGNVNVTGTNTLTNAGLFTNTQMNEYTQSLIHSCDPATEYHTTNGGAGVNSTDAVMGCISAPAGSTVTQVNGITGFATTSDANTFAVGMMSHGRCLVNNTQCWGANWLVQDVAGKTGETLIGAEGDCNPQNTTYVSFPCLLITGAFAAQPTSIFAVDIAKPLGGTWTVGYITSDGATNIGAQYGSTASVAGSPSQQVNFLSRDGGNIVHTSFYNADANGNFVFNPFGGTLQVINQIKTTTFLTNSANPATSGILRLANTDKIAWRDSANGTDTFLGEVKFKFANAGCTTAAAAGATCTTTITWPSAFADANYMPSCMGVGVSAGVPVLGAMTNKVAASITIQTVAITAAAAQFSNIDCMGTHN